MNDGMQNTNLCSFERARDKEASLNGFCETRSPSREITDTMAKVGWVRILELFGGR